MIRKSWHFIWDRVEMTRPHNIVVAALVIFAGWATAGGSATHLQLLWVLLAGALVAAAGNVINDYFDVSIDRINKPRRPIPSGRVSHKESVVYYLVLTFVALCAAAMAGWQMLIITSVWSLALYFYSAIFKKALILGNLLVSAVCSSGFLAGAWLAGDPRLGVWPAAIAFLLLMGREIVKDVEDLAGDQACGARTLARKLGERDALRVALGFFLLFAVLALWPYWSRLCGKPYLWTYFFGLLPLLGLASYSMLHDSSPRNLVRVNWILKLEMLVGVVGFYLGQAR